jgi:hypothetical protein
MNIHVYNLNILFAELHSYCTRIMELSVQFNEWECKQQLSLLFQNGVFYGMKFFKCRPINVYENST